MTDYTEVLRLCGCGILALCCIMTLRACDRAGIANAVAVLMTLLLASAAIGAARPLLALLTEKTTPFLDASYAQILWRATAIGMTAEVTADIIRDAGETRLADGVEFAARAVLLCLGIPLYEAIFSLAATLIAL